MSDYLKKCYKKQNISLLLLLKQKYQLMNTYSYHKVMLIQYRNSIFIKHLFFSLVQSFIHAKFSKQTKTAQLD